MQNALEVRHFSGDGDPQITSDAEGVDGLIEEMLVSSPAFSLAQVFSLARELRPAGFGDNQVFVPDHEVFVGIDPERSLGLIAFADEIVGNLVTDGGSSSDGNAIYYFVGEQRVFPGGSEVSIDLIRQALNEFLSSGGEASDVREMEVG